MPDPRNLAIPLLSCLVLFHLVLPAAAQDAPPSFLAFESDPVRPLALSPSGDRLFAVNTPDNRLEIFATSSDGLTHFASVPVGMEPVAVTTRSDSEVWVVNHLSDSVSIVDVAADPPRVTRTLLVGDEPRDIVFAGPERRRAFITTARRGQRRNDAALANVPGAGDPAFTTPGIGRADVWVFDAANLGAANGGTPLAIVELFGDTPRALAATPDGSTVYAAIFRSGNRTTTIPEQLVCDGFRESSSCPDEFPGAPGGVPGPRTNHEGRRAPEVGLIARYDELSGTWRDVLDRDWSAAVRFNLPDLDVFAIDAATLENTFAWSRVGTVLYNLAVDPRSGALYVSNTEARNTTRFAGPGNPERGNVDGSTVQGHLHEARLTVLTRDSETGSTRTLTHHLNPHIDYSERPAPGSVKRPSLATPTGLAVSSDGRRLWIATLGSSKVVSFPTSTLATPDFDPIDGTIEIDVPGGPTGLVLDEANQRIYVATHFDNAVVTLTLDNGGPSPPPEIARHFLHNPEPTEVVDGRPLFYDAGLSSNGEASCASCHVFAGNDALAWDLGNPDANVTRSEMSQFREDEGAASSPAINGTGDVRDFHPMKGPMTTLDLRGLSTSGALHWRGDRSTGPAGTSPTDPAVSLENFAGDFAEVLGRREPVSGPQMRQLGDFLLRLVRPPNPVRPLDNRMIPDLGLELFDFRNMDNSVAQRRCGDCHVPNPLVGDFGTSGRQAFQDQTQMFKVPHLRGLYQKVGMFGTPAEHDLLRPGAGAATSLGPQVRGYGFLHDGSMDTLFNYLKSHAFLDVEPGLAGFKDDQERRDLELFLLAYDNDIAPIVGQQLTLSAASAEDAASLARLDLFFERANARFSSRILGGVVNECDLIAKGIVDGEERGFTYDPIFFAFLADREADDLLSLEQLRDMATRPGNVLTFTCAPPGSGLRMGIDRDEDGAFDRDELDGRSDPTDPLSVPGPRLVVEPLRIDGEGSLGTETVIGQILVRNTGTERMRIFRVTLGGPDRDDYQLPAATDACSQTRLNPGTSCTVGVIFAPREVSNRPARRKAAAIVRSTDTDTGNVQVRLRANLLDP